MALGGGCFSGADEDRAGNPSPAESVELVIADHDSGSTNVSAWADAVERLSDGSLTIRAANGWRQGESNFDRATIGDVRRHKVDLAVVAARAFDEVGVTSFQPLVAPLLIDTPALERQVLLGDVGRRALRGAQDAGLVGLALLRNDVRRPIGLSRALVAPADYRGARVYTREGRVARATLRALGAHPVHIPTEDWFRTVDGAEVDLGALRGQPQLARAGASVTSNVVLWPEPIAIVINRDAFEDLSEDQQHALRDAATAAFDPEHRLVSDLGKENRDVLCRVGTSFVQAGPTQLNALRAAVEPVYRMIERGRGNADALADIRRLKGGSSPEPVACPDAGAPASTPAPAGPSELEATYRTHLTRRQLADSPLLYDEGELNDQNWGDLTLRLANGRVSYSARNDRDGWAVSGRYTIRGDVIEMHFDEIGETWGFRWSLYRGTLKLERDETLGKPPELHAPTPLVVKAWRRSEQ
jgi:TRAP-type C4-dicarboxylate transport system substrate-binding protein